MELQQVWFVIVGVLFLGFFVLEGFDFGVGMLMAPLGRVAKGDFCEVDELDLEAGMFAGTFGEPLSDREAELVLLSAGDDDLQDCHEANDFDRAAVP